MCRQSLKTKNKATPSFWTFGNHISKKKIEIPKKIFFEKINFWPTLPTSPPKTKHSEICQNIRVIHPTQNHTTQKYRLELNTMKLWFLKIMNVCIFSYTYYNLILITRPGTHIHPNIFKYFFWKDHNSLFKISPPLTPHDISLIFLNISKVHF